MRRGMWQFVDENGGTDEVFRFLEARSAPERMDELGRFLEGWYGPRRAEYGETEERLGRLPLPYPLRWFYAFAGRWPSPEPGQGINYFYTGAGGHHIHDLDGVKRRQDGKLNFFMEYQCDWDGLTLPSEEDPPVWIEGYWDDPADDELDDEERDEMPPKVRQVCDRLSKFLVTHCLMTTLYERENSKCSGSGRRLADWFRGEPGQAVRVWSAADCDCPNYTGELFLFHGGILVHHTGGYHRFAAVDMALAKQLREHGAT